MNEAWEGVRTGFLDEAREAVDEFDQCLLCLEASPQDHELVNRAFRAIHSLKGSAATLSFTGCAEFSHHLESLLIGVRDGQIEADSSLIDLCLRSSDMLRGILQDHELMEGSRTDDGVLELVGELERFSAPVSAPGPKRIPVGEPVTEETYAIVFRPHSGFFGLGADPALVLEELARLGKLSVRAELDRLPDLADLNAEDCWLGWTCTLTTSAGLPAIREVFEFCEDIAEITIELQNLKFDPQFLDCYQLEALEHLDDIQHILLELERCPHDVPARRALLRSFHSLKGGSGLLVSSANLVPGSDHPAVWIRDEAHRAESALERGQLDSDSLLVFVDKARRAVQQLSAPTTTAATAAMAAPAAATAASAVPTTVRVEQARLDHLLRVVGEAMMAHGALQSLAATGQIVAAPESATRFKELLAGLRGTGRELHERVMSLRMLPLRTVFQKFPRLVRDLGKSLGKDIRLVLEGETIELDRSVLERIGDPLVHLVRNSADHGLETPAERLARGKSAQGTITLSAVHEATTVIIHVQDDGRGLDLERLRARAAERGLSAASDAEACRLVFLPGLSTAAQVTDVSGRGVGMDVVHNNICELGGRVDITSVAGQGCRFSIRLPASLVVTRGIVVRCGGEQLIVPMELTQELVIVPPKARVEFKGERFVLVRDELLPLLDLSRELGMDPSPDLDLQPVAVVQAGGRRLGLQVDAFVNELEVLVKPLQGPFAALDIYAGAAILGDGRVLLVLRPSGLLREDGGVQVRESPG